MSCALELDAGPYVLGSLSPSERTAFEAHLEGCAECAQQVARFAGLPGLLRTVSMAELESLDDPATATAPPTLLPRLVDEVHRVQQRRLLTGVVAAVVLAIALVATTVALTGLGGGSSGPRATQVAEQAMTPIGAPPMSAEVGLTGVGWGTRLDLSCHYRDVAAAYGERYALVVRTADGGRQQVATWRALPGRSMSLTAATSAAPSDIRSVTIVTADGTPVLRLTPGR